MYFDFVSKLCYIKQQYIYFELYSKNGYVIRICSKLVLDADKAWDLHTCIPWLKLQHQKLQKKLGMMIHYALSVWLTELREKW